MGSLFFVDVLDAQEMRVTTSVQKLDGAQQPKVLLRSTTLFHAGKVYDYLEDVGELVILDPGQNQYVILDGNYHATRVAFEEVHQLLKTARIQTVEYLESADPKANLKTRQMKTFLKSQLKPEFKQSFDKHLQRLTLSSPSLTYEIDTVQIEQTELLESYLTYTDWAARLNYVLHPQSLFPESRIILNGALRQRNLLPVVVKLDLRADEEVHLKAKHKFEWELLDIDRRHIDQWEKLLKADKLNFLSFHEYQQELLNDQPKRTR